MLKPSALCCVVTFSLLAISGIQASPIASRLPAFSSGEAIVQGQGFLVLIGDGQDRLDGAISLFDASTTNRSYDGEVNFQNGIVGLPGVPISSESLVEAGQRYDFHARANGMFSLILVAKSIEIRASGSGAISAHPNDELVPLRESFPTTRQAMNPYWDDVPLPQESLAWSSEELNVSISARGVSFLSTYLAKNECVVDHCAAPMEGGYHLSVLPTPLGVVYARNTWYGDTVASDGEVSLNAHVHAFILGAPGMGANINGTLRLPLASSNEHCDCVLPQNQTLWATGRINMSGIHLQDDGSAVMDFEGEFSNIRFDEQVIDPARFGGSRVYVGATVAVVAVGIALRFVVAAFITRKTDRDLLENPRRSAVYQYVVAHPGANFREVVRGSLIASGTARHHLTILKRHGLVMEKPHRATMRYFENHGKYNSTWDAVVLLRKPEFKLLYDYIQNRGQLVQKDILAGMEERFNWSRSTTQHRLAQLVQNGNLSIFLRGRRKEYSAVPTGALTAPNIAGPAPVVDTIAAK